jgi:hypothetical protein
LVFFPYGPRGAPYFRPHTTRDSGRCGGAYQRSSSHDVELDEPADDARRRRQASEQYEKECKEEIE